LAELDDAEVREAVTHALRELGTVRLWDMVSASPVEIARQAPPDLIVNLAEGTHGTAREAQAPALFEWLGWRYTGSDPVSLAMTLDKWYT
jgi:D-alanine-D-alanine ligase